MGESGVAVVQHNTSWVAKSTKSFDVGEEVGLLGGEVSVASAANINDSVHDSMHKLTLRDNNGRERVLQITAQNETRFVYVGWKDARNYLSLFVVLCFSCCP